MQLTIVSNADNWKPCKDEGVFTFVKTFIDSFNFIIISRATKSPRYESSKNYDNTKLKGVQLQDKGTPLVVWDFHHEGVGPMSNLRTTPKVIFHSFVWLEARKTWLCAMPQIQGKEKIFDQNQLGDECVENLVRWNAWLQFIGQGKLRKDVKWLV